MDTNEKFEQEAMKYLHPFNNDNSSKDTGTTDEVKAENAEVKSDVAEKTLDDDKLNVETDTEEQEPEEEYNISEEDIKKYSRKPEPNIPPEFEEMKRQRDEFLKSINIEEEMEKMKKYVNPESDKVLLAWVKSRFPKLYEEAEKEVQQKLKEQEAKMRNAEETNMES